MSEDTFERWITCPLSTPGESKGKATMKTLKLLLPALLSIGTVVTALPDTADAKPRGFSHFNRGQHGNKNNVPELSVGAAGAALALLGGGLMIITGRRRRSKRD